MSLIFGQIRLLVPMATDRVIMEKTVLPLFLSCFSSDPFSRLFFIGSISYLQVTITYMRVWMILKFGKIGLLVSMATDRVIMERRCCHFFQAVFNSPEPKAQR